MPREIERKFLVTSADWKSSPFTTIRQGYLHNDNDHTVRVRLEENSGTLTIKAGKGINHLEYEYKIPESDARELLGLCTNQIIKRRYRFLYQHHTFEIDEFMGENEGLVLAELELTSEDEKFEAPSFLGIEVTHDHRYYNAYLEKNPFKKWGGT